MDTKYPEKYFPECNSNPVPLERRNINKETVQVFVKQRWFPHGKRFDAYWEVNTTGDTSRRLAGDFTFYSLATFQAWHS